MGGPAAGGEAGQARELAEIDRLRAALLTAVGHDLRTPLASIKAAVSSLRQGDVTWTAEEQAEFLATIEDSADRLDDLIANLLAMSRLQAGALSVAPRPVGLDEIVARALIGLRLEVVVDVPDNLPHALADPGLVERIVANRLVNAHRFSPPGAPVRVEADSGGDVVRLRVIDSGPGVSEEDREQMFSPFQRLGDPSTGGVGLDLAIARGFTEAMNGTLSPSTTPAAVAWVMTLTLPAATS